MRKFVQWLRYYNGEITWFIIGFLTFAGIDELSKENYISAILDLGLAYLNYKLYSRY